MLAITCLLAVVALAAAGPAPEFFHSAKFAEEIVDEVLPESPLTEHTFSTRLDHFRPQDGRTVDFTYTLNQEHFRPDGPIFIFVGDGGLYTTEWLQSGLIFDIARRTGAALATAEHRYFGRNIPTPTASFDDLQFLTVDQTLGDLSVLIQTVREQLATNGRVILWGTGYGAALAAHARKKFPHLVDGVFASSAYFRAEAIDETYYDNLSMILREHGGTECADRVKNAFEVYDYLVDNAEGEYLQERLRLCDPLNTDNANEASLVTFRLIDTIARYIHFRHLNGVQSFCRDMNAIPADTLNSLIRWVEYVYGLENEECINNRYETIVEKLSLTNWTEFVGLNGHVRSLEYLYCTQLGGLKVASDFALNLFPDDLITAETQYQLCRDVFGPQYNSTNLEGAVELLNFSYGGQDQVISHVVFSNAGLDPYIHHGIAEYDIEDSAVVFLNHDAAGADLRSISTTDSINLTEAKNTITALITRWATGAAH